MREAYEQFIELMIACWRYRWPGMAAASLVFLSGWLVIGLQKDIYEAQSRFFVDTSSQLRELLSTQIVESDVDDQLRVVQEAMLAAPQLEKVATKTGLLDPSLTPIERQRFLRMLRGSIQIVEDHDPFRSESENLYTIGFEHSDRVVAVSVVATLLDTFVEDAIGANLSDSEASGEFLRDQIAEYEMRLSTAEERLAEFNRSNFDRLPSLQGGYFQRLQIETQELAEVEKELDLAQSRLSQIEKQIRGDTPRTYGSGEIEPGSIEARILENESRLDELLLRFTDSHPDVVAASETIAQLKRKRQQQIEELLSAGRSGSRIENPVFQALQISKNEIEAEIASLEADARHRNNQVRKLRALIDEMPVVEAELAKLNRDYDVINTHYQALLNSLERDRLSRHVLESERVDFKVIEPPTAGIEPVAPKRAILLIGVFLVSCGIGVVISLFFAHLQPVLTTVRAMELAYPFPTIGVISQLVTPETKRVRSKEAVSFISAFTMLVAVAALVLLFEVRGPGLRSIGLL